VVEWWSGGVSDRVIVVVVKEATVTVVMNMKEVRVIEVLGEVIEEVVV
jgi:hypothetical protein